MSQDNSQEKQKILTSIEGVSFEQALEELEIIVKKLENGTQNLDNAIKDYERGTALKEYCEKKLREAKLKVEKIIQNEDGTVQTEEIDL